MERSKVLLGTLVLAAAAIIVWRVGFSAPDSGLTTLAQENSRNLATSSPPAAPNTPADRPATPPNDVNVAPASPTPAEPNAPETTDQPPRPAEGTPPETAVSGVSEPNTPSEPNATAEPNVPGEPNEPTDPNDQLEAVNLKDVEMKNIIDKIATWTGKTVIPSDEVMKQKITIYGPEKMSRAKALTNIYSALRMKGFVAEETDDTIFLKPITQARMGVVPTVAADEPLAMFENRDQIVRKVFRLENYAPMQMTEVVRPLVGEYGYVGADESTGTLMVIDTVASLMSIERVIEQFDVPDAGKIMVEFVPIRNGDPAEITQLIRMLMGASPRSSSIRSANQRVRTTYRTSSGRSANLVVIGTGNVPLVLIPTAQRRLIIVRGASDDVAQVHEWIEKLDQAEPVQSEYETVNVRYADVREVAQRINSALSNMPGAEGMRPSIVVQPLEQSRQVMIVGRADLRQMIKGLIAEIDMPAGTFETKVFELQHADPEDIKANIDSLYGQEIPGANYSSSAIYYWYEYGGGSAGGSETVKVIAFPMMKQVTVIASPENMRKIEGQIVEWDMPLDVDAVKPRIIELRNSDPVQMVTLLRNLFSESQGSSDDLVRLLIGDEMGSQRQKIVGPLYGQLTFEEVPGTKKIIVVSKIPAAYAVIEDLIYDLDRQDMAEVPRVVQLKYADPEDLAERLNAMFNEMGTSAPIRRTARGLSNYSMDQPQDAQRSTPNPGGNNERSLGNADEYTSPWSAGGARARADEEPISNVIGRVRFIPDPRSKSILVLAPPEFLGDIEQMIEKLDVPGRQMLIKAIIVEVDHSSMTSLGVQLATDPAAFGALSENSLTALGQLTTLATRGSVAPADNAFGGTGSGTISGGTAAVYGLIDFLMKTTNAKILNQQTLWTEDNEEAMFFKGEVVPFLAGSVLSGVGSSQQNVTFQHVGMVLQVRPSITPESRVDMMVKLQLSQLTSDIVNSQPVRDKMETETKMIVQDGETIMLGGMLFQRDSLIRRKLPLLGDLPLLGGLFRHNQAVLSNSELIVFVTPYVVNDGEVVSEKGREELQHSREKLRDAQEQLQGTAQSLQQKLEED